MSMVFTDTGRPRTGLIAVGVGLAILILLTLVLWPFGKVPQSYVGLHYGGGPFEPQRFAGEHIGPTRILAIGFSDHLYLYPATQRNYIISKQSGEGDRGHADHIEALNQDGVIVEYEVAVYFKLNLDNLRDFHNNIGVKYHAWCDGEETDCSDGWMRMLNDSFRQQLENALQTETRNYTTDEFLLSETLRNIQTSVAGKLKENVNEVLGDDYFCGPSYIPGTDSCPDFELVLKRPTLPVGVVEQYRKVQESLIAIETRENEVQQAKKQAEAIDVLNKALSSAQSADAYVLLKAIEKGGIDFWVIPGSNTNLVLPQRG